MAYSGSSFGLICLISVLSFAASAHAFGAGNIAQTSKIEGQNWRHGDIEDILLTLLMARAAGGKKFSKLDVKRVYFGNWLRDYSQAVDVGTVKNVSAEAIRILLWVLGFMSFGYGTKEFEVTTARLGCYRPEEHIDNPKDYADNEDARQYDRRLRGPVNERRELAVDEQTGLKNFIANERAGIDTSAGLVRNVFGRSIELGRRYSRSKNKDDLYEALRLLGTACHCLEDFSAHSNYTELALIELGERDVFPHVGRRTQVQLRELRQPVFPLTTGTFGPTDFLHSVMGEFNDKATQSEIQQLEETMTQAQNRPGDTTMLQDLLNKVPEGMFGSQDEAQKADDLKQNAQAHQMQNTRISPREPEAWLSYLDDVQKQIYPLLEWHDEVMKSITETIDQIPILPDLIEQLQEQVNVFVFSLLAPYVVPIINQVKNELNTGSSEIIETDKAKQHIVFEDDESSDPTHSMLAKDHFSNVLNEPAGKIASQVIRWVVPQLIACWDDEGIDVDRTLTRIINGVFHHPALRDYGQDGAADGRRLMFQVVENWWQEKSEREKDGLRDQLSRRGIQNGRNHKPGVVDHGHGCGKPIGMPTLSTAQSSSAIGGPAASAVMGSLLGAASGGGQKYGSGGNTELGKIAGEAVGGGALGSIVGGLAGGLLGGAFGGDEKKSEKKSKKTEQYGRDGSQRETHSEYGQSGKTYGQAQYTRTDEPGGRQEQYSRHDQTQASSAGYGSQQFTQSSSYDRQTYHNEDHSSRRDDESGSHRYGSGGHGHSAGYSHKKADKSDDDDDDDDKEYKKKKKREKKEKKERKKHGHKRHSDDDDDDDDDDSEDSNKKKHRTEHGRERRNSGEGERRRSSGYGGGGGREGGHSGGRRDGDEYGSGRQSGGVYGGNTYGRPEESSGRRGDDDEYGGGRDRQENTGGYGSGGYGRETSRGYGDSGYGGEREREREAERETETRGYGGGDGGRGGGGEYGEGRRERDDEGGARGYGGDDSYGGGRSGGHGRRQDDDGDDDDNRGYGRSGGGGYGGGESEEMPGGFGDDGYEGQGQRSRGYD